MEDIHSVFSEGQTATISGVHFLGHVMARHERPLFSIIPFVLGITEWVWMQGRISRQWDWLRSCAFVLGTNREMSSTGELFHFLKPYFKKKRKLLEKERLDCFLSGPTSEENLFSPWRESPSKMWVVLTNFAPIQVFKELTYNTGFPVKSQFQTTNNPTAQVCSKDYVGQIYTKKYSYPL